MSEISPRRCSGSRPRSTSSPIGRIIAAFSSARSSRSEVSARAALRSPPPACAILVILVLQNQMKIHEYQAKALLARYAVPVPRGEVAHTVDEAEAAARELGGSVVVKAQIHAGGRGKGGGVKI